MRTKRQDRQPDGRKVRQTDRQTDKETSRQTKIMKLIVAFINFANAPNKRVILVLYIQGC